MAFGPHVTTQHSLVLYPKHWRWLVVIEDLPPLPKRTEVWGYRWRRQAEEHARDLRLFIAARPLARQDLTNIRVERGSNRAEIIAHWREAHGSAPVESDASASKK
jgi:hypothetical protein